MLITSPQSRYLERAFQMVRNPKNRSASCAYGKIPS